MLIDEMIENEANALANYYYTDKNILQKEQQHIFRKSWQIVGRQEDLTHSGDYLTCDIAGEAIMVICNQQGKLHAMHNLCAHRGMKLVEGKGNNKHIFCPYHGWSYDLNGCLQGISQQKCLPHVDKKTVRLQQIRIDTWGGFIFVNLMVKGQSLRESLGAMVTRWEEYHDNWQGLREISRYQYKEPANWKILMENSTDYYHIPMIHSNTLTLPPVIKNQACGLHFMLTSVTPKEKYERFFDLIFPNMYFHVAPNKIQLFQVTPISANQSSIEITIYQTAEQSKQYPLDDPKKHRDTDKILQEDFAICRVLQKQAYSQAFRIVYTANELEEGVDHFNKMLINQLKLNKKDERMKG